MAKDDYPVPDELRRFYEGREAPRAPAPQGPGFIERILGVFGAPQPVPVPTSPAAPAPQLRKRPRGRKRNRNRDYISERQRHDVLARDGRRCKICGARWEDGAKLHVDHIVPVSKGGKATMDNLQTLCDRCNRGKGNRDQTRW